MLQQNKEQNTITEPTPVPVYDHYFSYSSNREFLCISFLFTFFPDRVMGSITVSVEGSPGSLGLPSCNAVESPGRAHDIGFTAQNMGEYTVIAFTV